jgi:hypothetical protein
VAKYEPLVSGLCIIVKHGVHRLYIHRDSKLIINEVMGESNYLDSRMEAYQQEVRRLEEKFYGFELHRILQRDNEVADALAQLGSSCEPPPPRVITQDLFKPSIRLEEDISVRLPESSLGKGSSIPAPGVPPRQNNLAPISEVEPGASAGPIAPSPGPEGEVAAIVGSPSPKADWRKPIVEYLWLGTIPDDEIKTRRLTRKAKGISTQHSRHPSMVHPSGGR